MQLSHKQINNITGLEYNDMYSHIRVHFPMNTLKQLDILIKSACVFEEAN